MPRNNKQIAQATDKKKKKLNLINSNRKFCQIATVNYVTSSLILHHSQ